MRVDPSMQLQIGGDSLERTTVNTRLQAVQTGTHTARDRERDTRLIACLPGKHETDRDRADWSRDKSVFFFLDM